MHTDTLSHTHTQYHYLRGVPPQRVHRPSVCLGDGQPVPLRVGAEVDDAHVLVVAGERQPIGGGGEADALDDGVLQVLFLLWEDGIGWSASCHIPSFTFLERFCACLLASIAPSVGTGASCFFIPYLEPPVLCQAPVRAKAE